MNKTKSSIDSADVLLIGEMGNRFGEVNKRLDRVNATLKFHARELAAGNQWVARADEDTRAF